MDDLREGNRVKLLWSVGLAVLLLILVYPRLVRAQDDVELRLGAVDTANFPIVRVTLLTTDARGAPADLSDLSVRENGAPISDLTFNDVPLGADFIFVLDANSGFGEIDEDGGITRREQALESIRLFTQQYMNEDGLDTVSIVVPADDGQGGNFLVREASGAAEVEQAITAYDPQRLGPTPLNAMLVLALEEAQGRQESGRYQAVLLMTDGRRLDQQLSYLQLVAQASDAHTPVYSAILGQTADDFEIDNVTRLSEPTRAFYVHLVDAEAAAPIYQIWQDQSSPVQIEYRSRQRQSGRNQLTLNLGSALVGTSFDIELSSPEVSLVDVPATIRRAGTAPDTPLEILQPTVQPLAVAVDWPDGLARQVSAVSLTVNGQPLRFTSEQWGEDDQGRILLPWNISGLDQGSFELAVEISDELGYRGSSEPVTTNIAIERPQNPTPLPTVETEEVVPPDSTEKGMNRDFLTAAVVLFSGLLLILLFWLRRRKAAGRTPPVAEFEEESDVGDSDGDGILWVASLEPLGESDAEPFDLQSSNVAVGSDAESVQLYLNDHSVNRLHARIRKQDQEYWLFDEGSVEGTYLNFERLGLAPQKLGDGDAVQFGKVGFTFHLRQIIEGEQS